MFHFICYIQETKVMDTLQFPLTYNDIERTIEDYFPPRRQTPTLLCLYKIKGLGQLPRGLWTLIRYDSASALHGLNSTI